MELVGTSGRMQCRYKISETYNTKFILNNIYKFSSYLTVSTTKINRLKLFRETDAVYYGKHKYIPLPEGRVLVP
jgi:hypothetical protein